MRRPWAIAIAFTLCFAIVLAALSWITWLAVRLDAAEALARNQAALEENVRLALWRMDSALGPLIAQESARPARTFLAIGDAALANSAVSDASAPPADWIKLRFQVDNRGELTLPSASQPGEADHGASEQSPDERLGELRRAVDLRKLWNAAPARPVTGNILAAIDPITGESTESPDQSQRPTQRARGINEFQRRSQNMLLANQVANPTLAQLPTPDALAEPASLMSPRWRERQLLLLRTVSLRGVNYLQGCWLDWTLVDRWLAGLIADLLPGATLAPVAPQDADPVRLLASLPVRLQPGRPADEPAASLSPLHLSLITAWCCVLLAGTAVAVLLYGVVSLSERRGAFVSAVTHELRTPLTTFRMYAEMLAEGMVPDEARRHYLNTLRAEAGRLGHLVENVLAYARLEHGHGAKPFDQISAADLVARLDTLLRARTEQSGMELCVKIDDAARHAMLRTDVSAVEQIVLNLVDNACKYASAASDRRVELRVARRGRHICFAVCDHGPGIPPAQLRRLFRPFSKSAEQAAQSAAGVGLGLALSRRLARRLDGRLAFECPSTAGAQFVLSLPCDENRMP